MSANPNQTGTADQRRETRQHANASVVMRLDPTSIGGTADNMSSVGLMFFTDEPLRVSVELEEKGERRTLTGRLVRVQRMNETNTGVAIEFDETT